MWCRVVLEQTVVDSYRQISPLIKANEHKKVWRLAGPLIISNISVALLGIVDTAVVGHLDHAWYLGAVAIGSVVFDFLYWGMGFLRMGTTGVVAQIHGRNDNDEIRTALLHAGVVALIISAAIVLFQKPVIAAGLFLIGGSEDVTRYAEIYIRWAIWGAPAVLVTMSLLGWMLGMQNARATLYIAVAVNLINIVMDFIFVFGLHMDVRGVALASVISQYSGLFLAAWFVSRELRRHQGRWQKSRILEPGRLWKFLVLNHNIFIRTLCLIFAFAFFTREGARQGDMVLAANAVLLNFQALMALGLDGFANAAEALVGKAIGAGDRRSFVESVKTAAWWSVIVALVFSLAYTAGGELFINMMTSIREVQLTGYQYLPWMIVSPLISVWCFLLDGVFIGATRSREMRDMMLISTFAVFIPAWYVLQFLGNHGLWLAFMLFFAARGASLAFASFRIERSGGFVIAR